jgi:rod shape determining protein RodA
MATTSFGATSGRPRDTSRRDLTVAWRHVDVVLITTTVAVGLLGVIMVYSATRAKGTDPTVADASFLHKELLFMAIGLGAMMLTALVDYHKIADWVWLIYGGALFLLVAVVSPFGHRSNGAQAWLGTNSVQLQPAEVGKIALILALGVLLAAYNGDVDVRRLGVLALVAGAPMVLIMLQPDLGMTIIYIIITMGMLLVGGLKVRYLLLILGIGALAVFGALNSNVLKQYQKDRLTSFTKTERDATTYNVDQSQTAIGAGGVTGEGLFNGQQTQKGFVPEQQTDFIFTVVGEETGFAGAATLLGLYAVMLWRIWRAAALARDMLGSLICVGVLSFMVFQVFENVGMTMKIMPVTGIPLPLVSYGGTSILTTFIGIGLVLNVHMRRFR